jgi:hypothetical protein
MLSKLKEKTLSHPLSPEHDFRRTKKNLLYQTCFTMFYTTDNFFKLHSHSIQSLFYLLPYPKPTFFSLPNICLLFAMLLPGTTSFRTKKTPHPDLKIDRVRGFFKLRQHQLRLQKNKTDTAWLASPRNLSISHPPPIIFERLNTKYAPAL